MLFFLIDLAPDMTSYSKFECASDSRIGRLSYYMHSIGMAVGFTKNKQGRHYGQSPWRQGATG